MSKTHRKWIDRFSDYLAGELDEPARTELEGHLAACGACRRVLEDVRDVVSRARGLGERRPSRDLWPGIAAAIRMPVRPRAAAGAAEVIALPTGRTVWGPREPGRIALSTPQLAAAAVVLIALSAVTTWWAGPGLGARPEIASAPAETAPVAMASAEPAPPDALSEELAALEDVLETARTRLDANTVRVLERNLAVIEQAIVDSHRALALDPQNEFLTKHLERVYERKIEYLRDAARVADWAS